MFVCLYGLFCFLLLLYMCAGCLGVAVAVKKPCDQSMEGKGFVWLTYPELQSNKGSQGRNSNWLERS